MYLLHLNFDILESILFHLKSIFSKFEIEKIISTKFI